MKEGKFQELAHTEVARYIDFEPLQNSDYSIPGSYIRVEGDSLQVRKKRTGEVMKTSLIVLQVDGQTFRFSAREGQLVVQMLIESLQFRDIE